MKREYLIAGGIGIAAIAAFFLLSGDKEDLVPSGGSSYGQSGGYEGGGPGVSYLFGGDTINFPSPETINLSSLLPDMPQTESNDLRYAKGGDVIGGITLKKPFVSAPVSSSSRAASQAESKDGGVAALLGSALNTLFAPAIGAASAVQGLASVASSKTGSGISSGSGTVGVAKKPFVVANTGSGWYTSSSGGKTFSYNQSNPGASGSGYVVRGYSLTGKPLYKPVK